MRSTFELKWPHRWASWRNHTASEWWVCSLQLFSWMLRSFFFSLIGSSCHISTVLVWRKEDQWWRNAQAGIWVTIVIFSILCWWVFFFFSYISWRWRMMMSLRCIRNKPVAISCISPAYKEKGIPKFPTDVSFYFCVLFSFFFLCLLKSPCINSLLIFKWRKK